MLWNSDIEWSFVWEWSHVADTTSVTSGKSDESFFSPWSSPWVFDFPRLIWRSDQKNSVVKSGSAVSENSWAVFWPVSSINGNWDGSSDNGVGQVVTVGNVSETWNFESSSIFWTGLFDSFVSIFTFVDDTFSNDVFEGVIHKSSVTGLISIWTWAINELLFWETFEGSISEFAESFQRSGSWESPTWSTLSLVFNSSDGSLSGPVDFSTSEFVLANDGWSFVGSDQTEVHWDEFFFSQGRELIDSHFVGVFWLTVVKFNLG